MRDLEKYVYPRIRMQVASDALIIETLVRFERDETFYLTPLVKRFYGERENDQMWESMMNIFLADVHAVIQFAIPDLKSVDRFGAPLFIVDPNQQSERDRIHSMMPHIDVATPKRN